MDLTGKTAIVTGASRGIGRATALALAARGADVAIGYRTRTDAAEEVVRLIEDGGGHAFARAGDITDEATVLALFDEATERFGGVDVVVANAARQYVGPFDQLTVQDFDQHLVTELRGYFLTLREAARQVRDHGRIIAVSTVNTRMLLPQMGMYLGLKGAVEQFVRVLSRELGPRQITVNTVAPGATDTDAFQPEMLDLAVSLSALGRIGQPEEVAELIAFLAGPGGRWVTNQDILAGGGLA
ncbi:SDR family oxidoreductase [Auraticoccus monumenti]|uniref:3-oxoacyl-[acyl-carrier protein] reductase n=1 Tax=Auraticoccus monumenti TaxID=675864 RepID=A0A1G7BSV7_9ACTN|nr:SDR family oxidoreductase [Auraticoccus monumenti]SDE29446.1 3-oxoacyl-[acyl-carrier protein] reductase [Auraticoccus monumenti]